MKPQDIKGKKNESLNEFVLYSTNVFHKSFALTSVQPLIREEEMVVVTCGDNANAEVY